MEWSAWAAALEASALGAWMRSSSFAYPAVNLTHVFGLVLLLGPMLLLDARLLGLGRRLPLAEVSSLLTPLAIAGLVLLIGTGVLLFAADAEPLLLNPLFPLKLACIGLAIANAIAFRVAWGSKLKGWGCAAPIAARVQAGLSALLWVLAASFGRLLAYV